MLKLGICKPFGNLFLRKIVAENMSVGKRGETPVRRRYGRVCFTIRKHRDKSACKQGVAKHLAVLRLSPLQGCCGTAGGGVGRKNLSTINF